MAKEIILVLITSAVTLIGIWVGNLLSHRNSYLLFEKQKTFENQRLSYSKLMALKNPWTQTLRTHYEKKILAEYYDYRFINFSHEPQDREDARYNYDSAISLILEITKIEKEIFETIGIIETCFELTDELKKAIDALYNYESIEVHPFNGHPTLHSLETAKQQTDAQLVALLKQHRTDLFNNLINVMKPMLVVKKP
ncbi:hypothetical protein [Parapedobacter soli]|uniref:hypothetical protein n=1 Tax=Parapedobacter soli TaxID=416955 RepID=UPI0021C84150|nr:hypothetical protein [Parapedobacter soli]